MNSKIYTDYGFGSYLGIGLCAPTLGIWDIVIDDQNYIYVTAWVSD